jgi:hypothetical protein
MAPSPRVEHVRRRARRARVSSAEAKASPVRSPTRRRPPDLFGEGLKCDLTETAARGFQRPVSWARRAAGNAETVQLGRPRRNSMIAALTSAGRSCWVQCLQRGSIWMSRSRGTTCFMLAICSAAPGNATTIS